VVFEEAADDRAHADVLRQARHAGTQRADAAHDQVDLDAGLAGFIQGLDDLGFEQRVHLGDDACLAAGLRAKSISARIAASMLGCSVNGACHRWFSAGLAEAGELLENLVDVVADLFGLAVSRPKSV
jgi:hypothetical protein